MLLEHGVVKFFDDRDGKKFGFLKPQMYSTYAQSKQDFGVMVVDTSLA